MKSSAACKWEGSLSSGSGTATFSSGAAPDLGVSWATRTEASGGKTSPEELIAAAHASCYCMQLSHEIAERGATPGSLDVNAVCTFLPGAGITTMALTVTGTVPGMDAAAFSEAAEAAKNNCPVSGALKGNVEISLEAQLA